VQDSVPLSPASFPQSHRLPRRPVAVHDQTTPILAIIHNLALDMRIPSGIHMGEGDPQTTPLMTLREALAVANYYHLRPKFWDGRIGS